MRRIYRRRFGGIPVVGIERSTLLEDDDLQESKRPRKNFLPKLAPGEVIPSPPLSTIRSPSLALLS